MKLGIFSRSGQLANEDQAYDFGNYVQADGVNDKGTLASAIDFDNNSPWALSFWAKGSASSNQTNMIFSKTGQSNYYVYLRHGRTPNVRFAQNNNNGRQDWTDSTLGNWNDGAWHHVYIYSVGTDVHLVYDGVNKGDGGGSLSQEGLEVGNMFYRQNTNSLFATVGLDDAILHQFSTNKSGSIAQAQSLYNSSSGSNPATALGETPDFWYKFDVSNGTTTIPNSGGAGGNNLTLTNFSGTYILEH